MTWTLSNLIIQIITGILGGHFAATLAREHSFGFFGHTLTGLTAGAFSGYFLQSLAATVVTANGSLNELRPPENFMLQALTGIAAGACLTLIVGFIRHSIDNHKSPEN